MTEITVLTITRGRPQLLERAMRSLQTQDYAGPLEHVILVDGCLPTLAWLRREKLPAWAKVQYQPRAASDRHGCTRLARLRNRAVSQAQGHWVAFLDDDNEFDNRHLSSLVACARHSGCPAVHSHRRMFWRDGRPYLEPISPWQRDPKAARIVYEVLCGKGVLTPGSNLVRDQAALYMVDLGCWLFEKELLTAMPFSETYTRRDWEQVLGEDDKLVRKMAQEKVPIACTHLPTLKYYLGGFSNMFAAGDTEIWETPDA